ncbi:hypothetical protein [Novosphingobium sp. KACC 22771]|uniref:hypothetical protein n=1 Tax=Novosphingobium sp. KACC 22771 TaxID=3025670 RepID=UPI002366CCFE|nr:hypothetical protein [Novosphingobium sp. KACC 22771]WDF72768.1 hypothetical protein PQ467_01625 [Novosphingobium sp. KACC 22771]
MVSVQGTLRWDAPLSQSIAPIMCSHAWSSHRRTRLDKERLAPRAHRIHAMGSDLSGLKFILNMGKASLGGNLRRGHEALLKIQVHGLHFKLSIPAHSAIPGPTTPREGPIFPRSHSLSQPKACNAGWYMYYKKTVFFQLVGTMHPEACVHCTTQHRKSVPRALQPQEADFDAEIGSSTRA